MNGFIVLILVLIAICAWQLWAGISKLRAAKANPSDPMAPTLRRVGMIQTGLGGLMLLANLLLNLPALRMVMGG